MIPNGNLGLRHLALNVVNFEACKHFYTEIIGMGIEWEPDPDNLYLTSGRDNLALHKAPEDFVNHDTQRLDHLGFILESPECVERWHQHMTTHGVEIISEVKKHRDGAVSFYCKDPDGNTVQMIFHPPISAPMV